MALSLLAVLPSLSFTCFAGFAAIHPFAVAEFKEGFDDLHVFCGGVVGNLP